MEGTGLPIDFLQNTLNSKKKRKHFVLLLLHVKTMPTGATCINGEVRTPYRQNTVEGTGDSSQNVSASVHWKGQVPFKVVSNFLLEQIVLK
jgi:hypothetical protein